MNRRMIFYITGQIIKTEAALFMLPFVTGLIYKEWESAHSFAVCAVGALALGFLLTALSKPRNRVIYSKEGFAVVALAWVSMSAIGALPFVIAGEIPSYIDAFFEIVSGFTTTGASILKDVEAMSHAHLMWRSFSHWVGGMGVLVFVMALLPKVTDHSIHIMRAEMPGPIVGKLVPKARQTARILYLIYIVLTAVQVVILLCCKMPLFDSLLNTFGTAGTGGLAIKADSFASYNASAQVVTGIFMFLFGINFNLFYLIMLKRIGTVLKSEELRVYTAINVVAIVAIAADVYHNAGLGYSVADSFRHSLFQTTSIMSTTGYASADFIQWPVFSRGILLVLMFMGAMAGSTAGGLKVSRVILLFKLIKRELRRLLHPRSVTAAKFEGKEVDDVTLNGAGSYFALYMVCFFVIFLSLGIFGVDDFESNFTATVTCFNNVGPGISKLIGPMGNFSTYSPVGKLILSFAMLLGRLELYPLLFALTPTVWLKKFK